MISDQASSRLVGKPSLIRIMEEHYGRAARYSGTIVKLS